MGNTTSMKAPHMKASHAHKHGDVTCTMKHGRRRHRHSGRKHYTAKRKHRRNSGGSLMNPLIPDVKKPHKRSKRKHSGGVGFVAAP